ncbi:GNAT family N-acetyltransferase [Streptomyces sp. AJS327]|uniref:GNAT family N-acetyltransferase n=1 Tax=Streptomyces sp. AJS327 TaxID=2545265 RepID=UPI0015DFFCA0|nr:GNAT family N-acetyltransferase [Streptomyces sp. AJS327]MBA0052396.1 GNAT family N-acetyltransferase [Streptomyces sp. AJS327]
MVTLSLSPPCFSPGELAEVVEMYASNPDYWRDAGEYDPEELDPARIEADLRAEVAAPGCAVLLARDAEGVLLGQLTLLDRHPVSGHPWIALLMVHGRLHRAGVGRRLAAAAERRFADAGGRAVELAVLENRPSALAFWTALGWREIDRRPDVAHGRPCVVLSKPLC